jgi:hypothetical protein
MACLYGEIEKIYFGGNLFDKHEVAKQPNLGKKRDVLRVVA